MQKQLLDLKPEDYERQREHIAALEHTRADLMGVNEELHEKIGALERGQEELLKRLSEYEDAEALPLLESKCKEGAPHKWKGTRCEVCSGWRADPELTAVSVKYFQDGFGVATRAPSGHDEGI